MPSRSIRSDEEEANPVADAVIQPVADAVIQPVATRAGWCRSLKSLGDIFVSVEQTRLWYLHLVYAKKDAVELRNLFTQRFAALTTMISLLVASQVGTLFSPSQPTQTARTALAQLYYRDASFWACLALCLSLILSLLALLATLSAWALFNAVGTKNVHIIFRSSMCLPAAALPVRMATISIFFYFVWVSLFWYVIAANYIAIPLSAMSMICFFVVVSTYSAVGRVIMYSGALGTERIMDYDEEGDMDGTELATALVEKCVVAKEANIPVSHQYRIRYQKQLGILEAGGSLQLDKLLLPEYRQDQEVDHDIESGRATSVNSNKED